MSAFERRNMQTEKRAYLTAPVIEKRKREVSGNLTQMFNVKSYRNPGPDSPRVDLMFDLPY